MSLKKFRILLDGNKYFGNLLTMKLHRGTHAIKFSFRNKIKLMNAWERSFVALKDFLFPDPQIEKKIPNGESCEITYHVEKRKLEIKQEIKDGEISRRFLDVPEPISSHLFTLYFRNMEILKEVVPESDDLIFTPAEFSDQIAIIFSLVNADGMGFRDSNFDGMYIEKGNEFDIDLSPLPSLKVAVITDTYDMRDLDFMITSPLLETKIT